MNQSTLNSLLQWGIQNQKDGEQPEIPKMTPEEMKENMAFMARAMGESEAEKMKGAMHAIETMKDQEQKDIAWDNLELLVESLDNANDLEPLKLWPRILAFISMTHENATTNDRRLAAWVIGTAIQNNDKSLAQFLSHQGLDITTQALLNEQDVPTLSKLLYAISNTMKGISSMPSIETFIKLGGMERLADIFEEHCTDTRITTRILFFTHRIIWDNPEHAEMIFNSGAKRLAPRAMAMANDDDLDLREKASEFMTAYSQRRIHSATQE